jgi:hypothetical protein
MMRTFFLVCAIQLFNIGLAHSQTRDQIIVLALLGSEPGDKVDLERMSAVIASSRADHQTLDVKIKAGADQKTIRIKENPHCIFSIGTDQTYYATLDFTNSPKIFADGAIVWVRGRNVSCSHLQGGCFDFAPLSFLGVPEKLNEKQLDAAKSLGETYCRSAL